MTEPAHHLGRPYTDRERWLIAFTGCLPGTDGWPDEEQTAASPLEDAAADAPSAAELRAAIDHLRAGTPLVAPVLRGPLAAWLGIAVLNCPPTREAAAYDEHTIGALTLARALNQETP